MNNWTNGELTTIVAPLFDKDAEDVQHTIILAVVNNGETMGIRTTECKTHTRKLLIMALTHLEDMEGEFYENHTY